MYTIKYYSKSVQDRILALPNCLLAYYFCLTNRMSVYGINLGPPHTVPASKGLFELRLKSKEGFTRVVYCTSVDKHIVMLHSFVKKTKKKPKQDLDLALERMTEVKNANT